MDFNRKLENLLQDIREIENDAVDVSNSREISKIEMDILMEKVRRLYDQLIQIDRNYPYGSTATKNEVPFEVSDNRSAETASHSSHQSDQVQDESTERRGSAMQKESSDHGRIKDTGGDAEESSDTDHAKSTYQQGETDGKTGKEKGATGKEKEISEKQEATGKPSPPKKESAVNSQKAPKTGDKTNSPEKESWKASRDQKTEGPEVVADKYQNSRTFRHDDLAKKQPQNNLSTRMQSRPINDLAKAIGLNDKFLFIRELFNGDKEKYHEAIQIINEMPTYEEAENYIRERFDWDEEQAEVEKFMDLVRRKFSEVR